MLVLVQGLPIYSERWLVCQKPHGIRRKMTNRTYIVSSYIRQNHDSNQRYPFRFYDIKLLAITISFIAYTTSVKVSDGNRW